MIEKTQPFNTIDDKSARILTAKCWSFPLPIEKIDDARHWFHTIYNEHFDEIQHHMQHSNTPIYSAWLQTSKQNAWIIEYWQTATHRHEHIKEKPDSQSHPFLSCDLDWQKHLCENQFDSLKRLQPIIQYQAPDFTYDENNDDILASVMPIRSGKYQQCVTTINHWQHNQKEAMDAYCHRMGIRHWQAWIEQLADAYYLIQYHILKPNSHIDDFYDNYQLDASDFAEHIRQFGIECCDVDLRNQHDWYDLEDLCHISRPHYENKNN